MINITENEYDTFRVACPRCNRPVFSYTRSQHYDRYCKKCTYRAGFYYNSQASRMLNYEEISNITSDKDVRRFMIRVIYPEQTAEITILQKGIFAPTSEPREQYRKPLKEEYFDERCLVRIEGLDELIALFRKMSIMR